MSAGARFRLALSEESPLQVAGAVNAYTAMMAEKTGVSFVLVHECVCVCVYVCVRE